MIKVAALLWIIIGTVFAGFGLTVVLTVPSLEGDPMQLIPMYAGAGFLAAVPISFLTAWYIGAR